MTSRSPWAGAGILIAALLWGCERPDKPVADDDGANQSFEDVRRETREAVREFKDFVYSRKDEFVSKMSGHLDEMNQEVELLGEKISKLEDAAKVEAEPRLRALREETSRLRDELDRAKYSTESAWKDVQGRLDKASADLKTKIKEARQWASEKIAPEPER